MPITTHRVFLISLLLVLTSCAPKTHVVTDAPAPQEETTTSSILPTDTPIVTPEITVPEKRTFDEPVTIAFTGDIMMGGSAARKLRDQGPSSFFTFTTPILKSADGAIGNLEGPLGTEGENLVKKTYTFLVDPSAAKGLKDAGFTLMTMANNHMLDFSPVALRSTFNVLKEQGLAYSGAGENITEAREPGWFEVRGRKVAVLAYTLTYPEEFWATKTRPGCAPADAYMLKEDIESARAKGADLIFTCFHWGREKETKLRPYQRPLAHAAIEAGADGVIGHHPHIWQGVEVYRGKPIAYSLGNFVFGSYSPSATTSGILKWVFDGKDFWVQGEIVPLDTLNSRVQFDPKPLAGAKVQEFCSHLGSISTVSHSKLKVINNKIEWTATAE